MPPVLDDAIRLVDELGFRYITSITWAKTRFGPGQDFRGQTEQLLFARCLDELVRLDRLGTMDALAEFVVAARDAMERIHRAKASKVHIFPAVPVAGAVEFGRSLQKKIHPPLELYDFHQASNGWRHAITLAVRPR